MRDFIEYLHVHGGRELDAEDIADLLWLAAQLPPQADEDARPDDGHSTETVRDRPQESPGLEKRPLDPQQPKPSPRQESAESADLYLPGDQREDGSGPGIASLPFRSPGVTALPQRLALGRALRPLKRTAPSPNRFVLDEAATVQRIADEGNWLPVLRPARERWLELVLVADESPSMTIWYELIGELQTLLEQSGAFRTVQRWGFYADPEHPDDLRFYAGSRFWNTEPHFRQARELNDPRGRRLILLVSDCVSAAWRQPAINDLLAGWKETPVTLVQVLPEHMWAGTGLWFGSEVFLRSPQPGLPNSYLHWVSTNELDLEPLPAGFPLPIVSLEPELMNRWARGLVAKGDAWMLGRHFAEEAGDLSVQFERTTEIEDSDAEEALALFRSSASEEAKLLARYLSAVPLNLPVIRMVQQVMFDEPHQSHLAEIFLSGLVERKPGQPRKTHPDRVEYDFIEGARDLLRRAAGERELLIVLTRTSTFVDANTGLPIDFPTLLADPSRAGFLRIDEKNLPFASIAAETLRGMGKPQKLLADSIIKRANERRFEESQPNDAMELTDSLAESESKELSDRSQPTTPVQGARASAIGAQQTVTPVLSKRYAVIIGISQYQHPDLNLRYAHRDAEELYDLLRTPRGGGFPEENIVKLIDEEATTRNLTRALRSFLQQPGRDDIFLIYLACHSAPDPNRPQNVYLITHDTDPDDIPGTALPMKHIQDALEPGNLYAERVVLIADTCHSGAVGDSSGRRAIIDEDAAASRYIHALGQSKPGMAILTSAKASETSREDARWGGGHGVFTWYLLEGLRGKAGNSRGEVTVGGLFDYVQEQVRKDTRDQQHPVIGSTAFDREMVLTVADDISTNKYIENVPVLMYGDVDALLLIRQALLTADQDQGPSRFIREADHRDREMVLQTDGTTNRPESRAPLQLTATDGRYLIRRTASAYPVPVSVDGYDKDAARLAVSQLEHAARWLQVLNLGNTESSLPANAVTMEFYVSDAKGNIGERIDDAGEIRMQYQREGDQWVSPKFMLKLINNTDNRLYCALLSLTENFAISTAEFLQDGGEWLEPRGRDGSSIWAFFYHKGMAPSLFIPKSLRDKGMHTLYDILKLIVSTEQFDATILERANPETATRGRPEFKSSVPRSSLDSMLERIQTRDLVYAPQRYDPVFDWTASQVTLTVTGPVDGALREWDLQSGAEKRIFSGHQGVVWSVALTADGRRTVSASHDHTLRVWNIETGEEERVLSGHENSVNAVAVTPDGRRAVSASSDQTLRVWDLESGAEERVLRGHKDAVMSVAVTPDGRRAVSASYDQTLRVWDLESGAEERVLRGHKDAVMSVAVTPDGRQAISASGDGTLRVWDLETGIEERILSGHKDGVRSVAVTPDGRRGISACVDRTLRVWDLESGAEERVLTGHDGAVNTVAVTPDAQLVVSGADDRTLRVWDISTGLQKIKISSDYVFQAVAIGADGKTIVTGDSLNGWR